MARVGVGDLAVTLGADGIADVRHVRANIEERRIRQRLGCRRRLRFFRRKDCGWPTTFMTAQYEETQKQRADHAHFKPPRTKEEFDSGRGLRRHDGVLNRGTEVRSSIVPARRTGGNEPSERGAKLVWLKLQHRKAADEAEGKCCRFPPT